MAKIYLKAHDLPFCKRSWSVVLDVVQQTYEGLSRGTSEKVHQEQAGKGGAGKRLIQMTSTDSFTILNHAEADVSTNVFLRILHNRACGFGMDYSAGHSEEK